MTRKNTTARRPDDRRLEARVATPGTVGGWATITEVRIT